MDSFTNECYSSVSIKQTHFHQLLHTPSFTNIPYQTLFNEICKLSRPFLA